jgi:hypothetical protein
VNATFLLTALLAATPETAGLHLSVETDPRPGAMFPVHLSVHGFGAVEVVLTALPTTPEELVQPAGTPSEADLREPPLLIRASALRAGLARTYREIHAALTPDAQRLVRGTLRLPLSVGQLLESKAEEPSRVGPGTLRAAWRVDPSERGWNEFDLDVGPLEPGLYRLAAHRTGEWNELRLAVSDLALLAARDPTGTVVLATRFGSGEPVADVEVFASSQNQPVLLGKTNALGLLVLRGGWAGLESSGEGADLFGQRGELLARVALPPSLIRLPPESGTAALFLDRPRYVPGSTAHLWAIARDVRIGSGGERSLNIPDSNRMAVALLDAEGRALWQRYTEADPFGVVSADVELPLGLRAGDYTIALSWGDQRRGVGFSVVPDIVPELTASLKLPDRQGFVVSVLDRLGRPLPEAWVHWSLVRAPDADSREIPVGELVPGGPVESLASGDGVTGATGALEVRAPKSLPASARIIVQVEVEDAAGRLARAQGEMPSVPPGAVSLRLLPDRLLVRPGKATSIAVEMHGHDPHVKLEARLRQVVEGPGGEPQKRDAVIRAVETDAHGHGVLSLPGFLPGYVEVSVGAEGQPASALALVFVTEQGGDIPTTPDRMLLVAEPPEHHRPRDAQRAVSGSSPAEDQRVLIMTPFESGTVLVTTEPATAGAPLTAAIHGYSGIAHLHPGSSMSGLFASAAALRNGRLFRQWVQLVPPGRASTLAVRGSFEHPPRTGQHAVLSLQTEDAVGRPLPSLVLGRLSLGGDGSASLVDQLHPPHTASAAFGASSAWWTSGTAPHDQREVALLPYGPTRTSEPTPSRSEVLSFVAQTGVAGRGQVGLSLPSWLDATLHEGTGSALLALRAVAGSEQLGETAHETTWLFAPRLTLLSPTWARAGDVFTFSAEYRAGDGASSPGVCGAQLAVSGRSVPAHCDDGSARVRGTTRVGEGLSALTLSATLQPSGSPRLAAQQEVAVAQPSRMPRTAPELARMLARGLAQPSALEEQADLACAAVRALGSVLPTDQRLAAAAVARLAQLERPEGGFGDDSGELRRDLAALEGLAALRDWVDAALLERTRARVELLARRLDEDQRRLLFLSDGGPDRRADNRRRELTETNAASAIELAHRQQLRRPRGRRKRQTTETQPIAHRLLALLPSADVLDLAEIAVALQALPGSQRVDAELGAATRAIAVDRRYAVQHRAGWTEALLAAGDEPAEPTESPLGDSAPSGAEISVTLAAEVGKGGLHCVRDPIAAGFAPIGLPASVVHDGAVLLCARPRDGRLAVGYTVRALRPGRFQIPPPAAGVMDLAAEGAPTVVEVVP